MSTLGGRLALAAMQWLGESAGDLRAIYRNRTCALDGIAEVTLHRAGSYWHGFF
jgi:hypothetical protein